jgi:ketosteroid isomerase-like protein
MSAELNTALVERYLTVATPDDLAAYDELFAADFVGHRPNGGEVRGPEGMKAFVGSVKERIRGLRVEVLDLFADGPMVAARIALRGTQAATGEPLAITEVQLYRIAGGKIAER